MNSQIIVALRITRSRIGMTVFANEKIEFARCLNLPCVSVKHSATSLRSLVNWTTEYFKDPTIVVEETEGRADPLVAELRSMAKERGLPIIAVATENLLRAYS